jgi:hypothetical protein
MVWLAYKYSLDRGIKIFRSMKYNSSLNLVCIYFSFLSKPPVPRLIGCWPCSFTLGVCFRIYLMTEVYVTNSC